MRRLVNLTGAVFLAAMLLSVNASADNIIYLSLAKDRTFCIEEIFGDHGIGEYALMMDDPGLPSRPWVDTHSAKFRTGPENPIIIPICFSTFGRPLGSQAILEYTFMSPELNSSTTFGICVSEFEDIEYRTTLGDPCEETVHHTDIFSFDIMKPERTASPGESVMFALLVSSYHTLDLDLSKVSGPKMEISSTRLSLPGEHIVDVTMTAPMEVGDYPFTINAKSEGCQDSWCDKSVTGTLHVAEGRPNAFSVELAPLNKNVVGIKSVKYYLSIENDGPSQYFSVNIETDDGLESNMDTTTVAVGMGTIRTIEFRVMPKARDHTLHTIKATVGDEGGVERSAEATLTVDEALSDAKKAEENDMITGDEANEFEELYDESGGLEKLDLDPEDEPGKQTGGDDEPFPFSWYIVIVAAVIIIALVSFYVYKRSAVTREMDAQPF